MVNAGDKVTQRIVVELEATLREQLRLHERMLELLNGKRAALASADTDRMIALCKDENAVLQKVSNLEKTRLEQAAKLTLLLDPKAPEPRRLGDLAQQLPEPARGRLLALRAQLRERMDQVRKQSAVAMQASDTLLKHMQGLIQTIGGLVTQIPTYTAAGQRPRAALAVSTFNTTG